MAFAATGRRGLAARCAQRDQLPAGPNRRSRDGRSSRRTPTPHRHRPAHVRPGQPAPWPSATYRPEPPREPAPAGGGPFAVIDVRTFSPADFEKYDNFREILEEGATRREWSFIAESNGDELARAGFLSQDPPADAPIEIYLFG